MLSLQILIHLLQDYFVLDNKSGFKFLLQTYNLDLLMGYECLLHLHYFHHHLQQKVTYCPGETEMNKSLSCTTGLRADFRFGCTSLCLFFDRKYSQLYKKSNLYGDFFVLSILCIQQMTQKLLLSPITNSILTQSQFLLFFIHVS